MRFTQVYQYNFPTCIRFGAGVIKELPAYCKQHSIQRPLLVTDPTVKELDFFTSIVKHLQQTGISVSVFSAIHRNPVKSDVYAGGDMYDANNCDAVIGIGGGAAIDVARAIVLRIHHREDLFVYDDLIGGDELITGKVPPFITVPTTAGTGSEVGRSAIIADDITHQKKILFSPKLIANIVFADPVLTMELPPAITAATGMDALTHNMEAFIAKTPHPICEGIALEGMRMIRFSLEKAVKKPDLESRSNMLLASMMGAIAFQKGLGVVHSLAHPLSSLLDTHHGLANAVNLPYGMRFNASVVPDAFKRMALAFELSNPGADSLVRYLFGLNAALGIPPTQIASLLQTQNIGVKTEHIETLADLAFEDFAHPNNPQPVSRQQFKQLYLEAL